MPTNLKNLLSRSRSRNELKAREEKGGENCCCSGGTCGNLLAGSPEPQRSSQAPCRCTCGTGDAEGTSCAAGKGRLWRDVSSRSLFSLPGDEASLAIAAHSRPGSPAGETSISSKLSSNSLVVPMRKCETVLALSTFSSGAPLASGSTSTTDRVRLMKDKIMSTSSSALNSIIHSSNKTTSKLFSGWKLSSSSSTSQSNSCVNSGVPTTPKLLPETMGLGGDSSKSRSQASIFEPAVAPLTPTNRLRRNGSLINTRLNSAYSRYSSVSSMVVTEEAEILCRLCLCSVKTEDTVEIQACSCRYCKDCLTAYVSFEVQEAAYDIACPDATCEKQGVLSLVEIEALAPTQLMEKHKKFRLYNDVEKDCHLMWCPSPGCDTICKIQESDVNGLKPCTPVIQCARCQHVYCTVCKLPCHPEVSCEIYKQKLIRQGKLSLVDEEPFASYDSIKKCPFCHVPIEKDSGCAQMMCKRCKHVFCWYCLASLDDDFLLRHYDKGPCKNKLGHSRASVVWHRAQVIGIFAGFGLLVLLASPLLILAAPCLLCCKCRYCANQLDSDESPASI